MGPHYDLYYLVSPLVSSSILVGLVALVLIKGRRDMRSMLFACMLLFFFLWSLSVFFMRSSNDTEHALLWEKTIVFSGGMAFPLYYHFTVIYTKIPLKKWILPAIYSIVVILALLGMTTDLAFRGMTISNGHYAPIGGPLLYLFYVPLPLLIFGGIYNLLKQYRLSDLSEERNRLVYLSVAAIFPLAVVALDAFTDLPPASIWGNLAFCTLCSVAILRFHLLDIRLIVRKGLFYLLVSVVIAVPYVGILFLISRFIAGVLNIWWVHVLIILFLAVILRPLYDWAQLSVDKAFYRNRYDYVKALEQFSQKAQSITSLKDLGSTLTRLVNGALHISSTCLLLQSERENGFIPISATGPGNNLSGVILRNSSPLVKWLIVQQHIISSKELNVVTQLQSMPLREKSKLKEMGAELFIPIWTKPDQLSGILVLGKKLSQQQYSSEDKRLLIAILNQMAISLENARLYDKSQQEVTERKRAEEALIKSESRYRMLAENMTDVVWTVDIGCPTQLTYISPSVTRLLGYSVQEAMSKKMEDIFTGVSFERAMKALAEKLATDEREPGNGLAPITLELDLKRIDGSVVTVEVNYSVIREPNGRPVEILAVARDIVERKRVERALQESEHMLRLISENSRDIICLHDSDHRYIYISPACKEILGYEPEELVGTNPWELVHPQDLEALQKVGQEKVSKGIPILLSYRIRKKFGEYIWFESVSQLIKDDKGSILGFVTSSREITERKRAESALMESEQRYSSLFRFNPDAVYAFDLDGRFINVNEATCRISGYSEREFLSMTFELLIVPEDLEMVRRHFAKAREGETRYYDTTIINKNGRRVNLSVTNMPIVTNNKITGVFGIAKDITELKQAEGLFRSIAVNSPVGIYIVQKGKFVYTNPQFQQDTGYREDELLGKEALSLVIPEDRETVRGNAIQMLKGKRLIPYEYRIINKKGNIRWSLETVAPIQYHGERAAIGSYQDITERKQIQEQLIVTDRLASIGELASGIAHEMNNPLTGVIGLSDLLLTRDLPEDIKEDLQMINKEAHRTANVVKNLLTFARKHPQEKKPVDIDSVIKMVLELRAYEQKVQNIQVATCFAPGLPQVTANAFQLMQVSINIITNAEYFMIEAHGKGTLTITTEQAGDSVRATFTDDGPGIPHENIRKIFDPFFTTKEVGKGTGLGLSICHGIVTEHGGVIRVKSKLGKGASFIVELPVSQEAAEQL